MWKPLPFSTLIVKPLLRPHPLTSQLEKEGGCVEERGVTYGGVRVACYCVSENEREEEKKKKAGPSFGNVASGC